MSAGVIRPRVIAGFGRSGTTWVQDVLASANSLRAVFEPLHPRLASGANVSSHRYRVADDDDPELYRYLHRYFFEEFHSLWADYRILGSTLLPGPRDLKSMAGLRRILKRNLKARDNLINFSRQRRNKERIVKFVRANMMLSWLHQKFDARIVFLMRHPAAVVLSQMSATNSWNPYENINYYRSQGRLLDVLDSRTRQLIFQSLDKVEAHTLSWCIENRVALGQAKERGIPVIHYEKLVQLGESEWRRVLSALDLCIMPEDRLIRQPSQQAWGQKASDPSLLRQYYSWMEHIDRRSAERVQHILDVTGMTSYNVTDSMPANVDDR